MKLYTQQGQLIQYTKQFWLGGSFGSPTGSPARESLFNVVLSKYLPDQHVILKLDHGENIQDLTHPVIENYSDHSLNLYYQNNNYITLTSAFNFKKYNNRTTPYYKTKNIVYFPFWLFFSRYAQEDDVYGFPDTRRYSVSCLNRNVRGQRMYLLTKLSHQEYFKDMFITVGDIVGSSTDVEISADIVQEFSKVYETLPKVEMNMMNEYYHCARIYEPGWGNSYLNIVTEPSIDDAGFLSEKIFKPIRAEQLFLIQGCPGTVSYLKSIGFDVFDDYIDHSRYDNEPNWQRRTDLMLAVLDEIYPSIERIFAETKQRRLANRLYLQSDKLENLLLKELLECIDLYVPPVL